MSDTEKDPVIVAAVEGGGTSFRVVVCRVVSDALDAVPEILHRCQVDSSHDDPSRTLEECASFLQCHKPPTGYHALGIATFGPAGVNPDKPSEYGRILKSSPKAAWRNVDILSPLKHASQGSRPLAVAFDTDVNAPAMAEYLHFGGQFSSVAYITVGTGVGVGLVVNGAPVHGRMHPEGGHVPVQPLEGDSFGGYSWGEKSPFHGKNTVEGLCCSVALVERLQKEDSSQKDDNNTLSRSVLAELPDNHNVWDHAANALANLCVTLLLTLSMEKIVIGGGIMQRTMLLPKIQERTVQLLNGYIPLPKNMNELICLSDFGDDAGLVGAMVLAQRALWTRDPEQVARERNMKREAFNWGLIHGMLVGSVFTALAIKTVVNARRHR